MVAAERKQARYTFRFSIAAQGQDYFGTEEAEREDLQRFVNNSLGLLTGGCEMCAFGHHSGSPALFCEKKKCPVNWGSPRCEHFVLNLSQSQDTLR